MKLASLKTGGRDGTLVIVDRWLKSATLAPDVATNLQQALDHWEAAAPRLEEVYRALNNGETPSFPFDPSQVASPLPRAYQWLDGSAYLSHVERVRRARGAEMPASFQSDPLMYQGGSDNFIGATDPICAANEDWGLDFEAEIAVITNDIPMGASIVHAESNIVLLMLVNDISLRNLIPGELAKGFGFLHGKPASSCSPVAVTPEELGSAWEGGKLHLPLVSTWNGVKMGEPDAGKDMRFDFPHLICHAARTRKLTAGTIIGSGTVSNKDLSRGCSCIVEKRVLEIIETGQVSTNFMGIGDRIRIEMLDAEGHSIFGAIDQQVVAWQG